MASPIFILGSHKSGTSLLRSLFDGHSKIFAVPIETHFFQIMSYWVTYAFSQRITPTKLSMAEFIRHATGAIRYSNREDNPLSDGISKDRFNIEAFQASLNQQLQGKALTRESESICFYAYMNAIHISLCDSALPAHKHVVEKSVENVEFAFDLHQLFPNAKMIHIIRNPYANLESMRKFRMHNKKTNSYPWLGRDFKSLYQAYYFLYRNRNLIPNYKVIRYEDLVSNPQQILDELCHFLALPFEDSMLRPTYMGEFWSGNSTSPESFKGISAKGLERYKQDIEPIVINLVNKLLLHVVDEFGYERLSTSKSWLLPARKEGFKEYVANRSLLLTE